MTLEEFLPSIILRASAAVGGFLGLYAIINGYIALQHRRIRKNSDEQVRLAKENVALQQRTLEVNKETLRILKGGPFVNKEETHNETQAIPRSERQPEPGELRQEQQTRSTAVPEVSGTGGIVSLPE